MVGEGTCAQGPCALGRVGRAVWKRRALDLGHLYFFPHLPLCLKAFDISKQLS